MTEKVWRWLAPLLVVLAAVAVYANTLGNGFTLDDDPLILRNPRIGDLSYVKYMLFDHELWRPLKRMTLMADYAIWGVDRPWGFHATNVVFHAAACLALYFFVLRLGKSRRLATVAALVFAVQPVHVEAVANICHRKESMSLLFYLLAFLAYLRAREDSPRRGLLAVLAGVFYLAGMLSKEVGAVMLPVVIAAYEALVAREPWRVRRAHLIRVAPVFAAVLVLYWFRGYIGTIPRRFGADQIQWVSSSKFSGYATMPLVAAKALTWDVGMMLWSWPLYFDRVFTIPQGVGDPWVLTGLALAAGGIAAVVRLARRAPLAAFAVAWFGLNLLPVSNVIPLSYWFVAERFLYLPSVGFALLVGLGAEALWRWAGIRVALGLLLVAYGGLSIDQNLAWKDPSTLWTHTLSYNPDSFRALYGYGVELEKQGRNAEAESFYRKAVALSPWFLDAHIGLSQSLLKLGRWPEAEKEAKIAVTVDAKDPASWTTVGNAELALGRYSDAVAAYREAVARAPDAASAQYDLANALYGVGDNAAASQAFDRAMSRQAPSVRQWLLRGRILRRLDRADDALAAFRRAAVLAPGDPEVPDATGRLLLSLGRRDEAALQFKQSLALKANQPEILEIQRRYGLN